MAFIRHQSIEGTDNKSDHLFKGLQCNPLSDATRRDETRCVDKVFPDVIFLFLTRKKSECAIIFNNGPVCFISFVTLNTMPICFHQLIRQ